LRSLTLEEFLAESTAAAELVERLVQAGAIPPLADGRFEACGGSFPRPDLTAKAADAPPARTARSRDSPGARPGSIIERSRREVSTCG